MRVMVSTQDRRIASFTQVSPEIILTGKIKGDMVTSGQAENQSELHRPRTGSTVLFIPDRHKCSMREG
jgi:hypothetical protein